MTSPLLSFVSFSEDTQDTEDILTVSITEHLNGTALNSKALVSVVLTHQTLLCAIYKRALEHKLSS